MGTQNFRLSHVRAKDNLEFLLQQSLSSVREGLPQWQLNEARRGPGRETELKVDSVSCFIHVPDESGKFGDERQKPHLQRAQILAFQ